MKNLLTMLKRITHRELSPKELEKTRKGVRTSWRFHTWGKDKEYRTINGEPTLIITERSEKTTPDISRAGIFHTEFYNDRTTHYTYTQDGKLVEKYVQEGNIYDGDPMSSDFTEFYPPGCWYGTQIEESTRNYPIIG